ncbi:hypothetical protein [Nocardioides cavernaquae]|uniref:hypothetical protein n=1 Tax=Nocardioides cavernaquae TaxID=2321396 RepID=UPI001C7E066C|nr:hypothetical protein [Nocardioides cavernaquae]
MDPALAHRSRRGDWAQDATYIQSLIDRLNARMEEQARLHRATYVDTRTSSIGHDACQNGERQILAALL